MILGTYRSVGPLDAHLSLWFNGELETGGVDEHDAGVIGNKLKTMWAVGYDFKKFHFCSLSFFLPEVVFEGSILTISFFKLPLP